ncbi:hypothetical protein [Sandaracinus amylolyticus]|nr:hypothetical protein [Sandaracinus amylolyticus]
MPALASDEEARSIVEVARAAQGRPLWQVSGAPCAEVPLRSDASVPVVAVMIDRAPALALVDTTKHVTELSRRRVSASGVLDRLQIGDVSVEGVPYFARALDEEQALASDVIDVVLGRDVLFRWRVQFRHGVLMRLGGPLDIGPGDSAELVVIGDTPTVALHQVVRRHVPRAMQATHHSVGWLAVDSTRTTAIAIAEGLLGELPAGYDRVSESDRAMAHIPGLEVGGVSPRGPYPILADYESSEGRVRGAVGWPFLGYCAQLGWRLFVQGCFGGPRAPHACNERLASGPRTHGECDLDHLR